jgi:hypothetical protein
MPSSGNAEAGASGNLAATADGAEASGRAKYFAWRAAAAFLVLFLLNGYIALRFFSVQFYSHLASAEGLFVAITRYAMEHPHDLAWLPLWFLGMPFHQVYPPGIHIAAAWLGTLTGWSPVHAWHFTVALLYCLGPSLLFWMAWRLSGRFFTACAAGLLWSVFSPSCVLVPAIWRDTAGMISNRRLHNIVGWGEGPNAVTLGIVVLAIGLLHLALTRGRPVHYLGAALAVAAVPLCSWPAFMALLMAIVCYLLSREPREWKQMLPRLFLIGCFAYAAVAVWLPPSTIFATYERSRDMTGSPAPGAGRALAGLALLALMAGSWFLLRRFRLPFWFRFAVFYLELTGWITLVASYGGPLLITQAERFHLAMEIGFILTLVFGVSLLLDGRRRMGYAACALLLAFSIRQTPVARRYARADMTPLNIQSTYEYQTAKWLDGHMHGERVAASGSLSFWMNVFTDTPQLGGCCEQSNISRMNAIAAYVIESGDGTGDRNVEIRRLWMQAFGIHAVALGGPHSRDAYGQVFGAPEPLIRALPVLRRDGDDYVLAVPSRADTLGHVMRPADLPSRMPANGLDIAPVEQYVDALENPAYPPVDERWPNRHTTIVQATLESDEILSFQMTYWPGWRATANGRPAAVKKDTFGFLYVEPKCSGACTVELTWDGGVEAVALGWLQGAAVLGGLAWLGMMWRRERRGPAAGRRV